MGISESSLVSSSSKIEKATCCDFENYRNMRVYNVKYLKTLLFNIPLEDSIDILNINVFACNYAAFRFGGTKIFQRYEDGKFYTADGNVQFHISLDNLEDRDCLVLKDSNTIKLKSAQEGHICVENGLFEYRKYANTFIKSHLLLDYVADIVYSSSFQEAKEFLSIIPFGCNYFPDDMKLNVNEAFIIWGNKYSFTIQDHINRYRRILLHTLNAPFRFKYTILLTKDQYDLFLKLKKTVSIPSFEEWKESKTKENMKKEEKEEKKI